MRITKLQLNNFRNYVEETIRPEPGLNLFVGANGQGKSALVEAAYILATSKSHRTSRDMDLISVGSESARISAEVDREERGEAILEVGLSRKDKKHVHVNRVRHVKISDSVGQLNAVIFSTADVDMVKGEPSERRRFLNLEISQVSPQYVYALGRYKRVLDQRNSVLKEIRQSREGATSLTVWDEQLAAYGTTMIEKRLTFLRKLSAIAEAVYSRLTDGNEDLLVTYQPNIAYGDEATDAIRSTFAEQLESAREHDLHRGTTTRGPHRDEIGFRVNGLDVRSLGSQGQQRSAALAVKLAEIELIEDMVGEPPVVLLDDVAAELDDNRRAQIFGMTADRCQTFVTATSVRELPKEVVARATTFRVEAGKVERV